MTGLAEDLKVLEFVGSPKCEGENVINFPRLVCVDLIMNIFGSMIFLQRCVMSKKLVDFFVDLQKLFRAL